ncbi:MAG: NAD-dependent epimerase/dehydratase family protein [Candidatus Aminicenantes bacterium]|nr:NAD-dependent epimerase/dehydratase family protein [Candidatus Aminicenantes bacterium]
MKTVVIAGATGFIGRALVEELAGDYHVIGLTRRPPPSGCCPVNEWRHCDLFSLFECERALAGAEAAFYLVHSMLPSARLTQGSFQDMDLISADNFARAAAQVGITQIIYLGGLIPAGADLSRHIRSRREVEQTLGSHGVPVTTLRAGIVIGLRGSSYAMFRSVLERSPLIFCPRWSDSAIQPVALADVTCLLRFCLEHPGTDNRGHDIGCPDILSYRELLRRCARVMGLRRLFIRLPLPLLGLSKLSLTLISGFPRQLVSPLVESLKHSLTAGDLSLQQQAGIRAQTLEQALRAAMAEEAGGESFRTVHASLARSKHRPAAPADAEKNTVRSLQRISLPPGKTARWLAMEYTAWLPRFFHTLLRAATDKQGNLTISSRFFNISLLELRFAHERSAASDRQLFYISGGLLAKKTDLPSRKPRLEFRQVLNGKAALIAIHDYRPTIPWPLYNLTQARAHLWVMKNFARMIGKKTNGG